MRSRVLLGLLVTSGLALLGAGAGCGGDDSNNTSSTGTGGSSSTSVSSSSSAVVGSTSSTGTVEDSNKGCGETAETLLLDGTILPANLDPVISDVDGYVLLIPDQANPDGRALKKGDVIQIGTNSKPDMDEFDQTYPDLVVILKKKDANGNWVQVAQNDDPLPAPPNTNDSLLNTIIAEDGEYCIEVTECGVAFGPNNCSSADNITTTDYEVSGAPLSVIAANDTNFPGWCEETATEPSDVAGTIEYENVSMSQLYRSFSWGSFASATDKDGWAFKMPAALKVDAGSRAACHFEFQYPGGTDSNGTTADKNITAYVVDAADPTVKLAEVDPNAYDTTFGRPEPANISMPCLVDHDYIFVMERTAGATAGTNDFYFFSHYGVTANPIEVEPNNDVAAPEALKPAMNTAGGMSGFVDGDLETAADVDYYVLDVPTGAATIAVSCEAQRGGSAIRGLKVTPLGPNDMPVAAGKGNSTEAAEKNLFAYDMAIPTGATQIKFKVEAASIDPNVSSHFYRCGLHLNPPSTP